MKKKIIAASMLVVILAIVFTTSVALADKPPTTVGERIMIIDGPITFPAGEPFYIMHGFQSWFEINEPIGNGVALSKMILEVDGEEVEPDYVTIDWTNFMPEYPFKMAMKLFTFNFPDGMTGERTFVRRYFFTCQSYENMGIPVDCKNPAELIEEPSIMQTLIVSFE